MNCYAAGDLTVGGRNAKHKNNLGKDSALIPNLIWLPAEYIDNPNGYANLTGWGLCIYVTRYNFDKDNQTRWSLVLGVYDNNNGAAVSRQLAVGTAGIKQRSYSNSAWSSWSNL